MSSYKDLLIWQRSMDFSIRIYAISKNFPREEQFGLTSQIRRSATSVPLNIAEGWGRGTDGSFRAFLRISRASLYELEATLTILFRLEIIIENEYQKLIAEVEEIGKMINGFIKKIRNKIKKYETYIKNMASKRAE